MKKATFAAGCFWGTEAVFRGARGIIDSSVGFMGGHYKDPTYEDVMSDTTGHAEVAQIIYDETILSYDMLLRMLFKSHDPTIMPGEKYKYRTALFYHDYEQKVIADEFIDKLKESGRFFKKINTRVEKASKYYLAESRHQHYYEKRDRTPRRLQK